MIRELLKRDDYITIRELAQIFLISERMVRYDLERVDSFLRDNGLSLTSTPSKGIMIDHDKTDRLKIVRMLQENYILSNEERDYLVLIELVRHDTATYEILAEAANVSRQTIINSMPQIEKRLEGSGLRIIRSKGVGLQICGSECDIRDLLVSIIIDTDRNDPFYAILEDKLSLSQEHETAARMISSIENGMDITFYDPDKLNAVLSCVLKRIKDGHEAGELSERLRCLDDDGNYDKYLQALRTYDLHQAEKAYLVSLFMNSKMKLLNCAQGGGSLSRDIAVYLMKGLEKLHPLDERQKERFLVGLTSHLDVALYRLRNNIPIRNTLRDKIRIALPLTYDYTKKLMIACKERFGIGFSEDEISFIAMYVGSTYETSIKLNIRTDIMLVCSFGTTTSSILEARIKQLLPDCHFAGPFSRKDALNYLHHEQVDLIVSTNDEDYGDIRTIVVNPLLYPQDLDLVRSALFQINYDKMCQSFLDSYNRIGDDDDHGVKLKDLISERQIQILDRVPSWRDSIRIAARPLLEGGKIEKRYVDEMIKAVEQLGTYMVLLPETAFVHAGIDDGVLEDSCSLLILRRPVSFGESNPKSVRNIAVISIRNTDKTMLLDLVNILNNNNNLDRLKQADVDIRTILDMHD